MAFSFFNTPEDMLKYFNSKESELHFDYDEISAEAYKRVFSIAKITRMDLLEDMRDAINAAIKEGKGFDDFLRDITPTLQKQGWLGKTKVINPKDGEEKEIYVGARRLKRIYETNIRTAYAKSSYDSAMSSSKKYFRYSAILDSRTRASHKMMHGIVLDKNDKFWEKNYPPNDWGCRCKVIALDDDDLKRYGLKPLKSSKNLPNIAGKDFSYSMKDEDALDNLLKQKAKKTG